MENNLNLNANIPAPNIVDETKSIDFDNSKKIKRYIYPKVGAVQPPKISQTPLQDTLELKRQEHPKIIYKLNPKKQIKTKLFNISSLLVFLLGVGAGIGEIIRLKK